MTTDVLVKTTLIIQRRVVPGKREQPLLFPGAIKQFIVIGQRNNAEWHTLGITLPFVYEVPHLFGRIGGIPVLRLQACW